MGRPMAANLVAAGWAVVGYDAAGPADRVPDGAATAASVAELAARCDTIFLSVPDGSATLAVVDEIVAAPQRRTDVVIDLSTIGPDAAGAAAARLADVGVGYADGPVSGGVAGARAGTISLMFSGAAEVLEAHRSLLDAIAGNVFHVGDRAGQGQMMKLVNNFLSATALAASSEAFALGEAFGLDLRTMVDVVNVSTGRNSATADKFPHRVLTGTYDTGFHTALMAKDVRLFNAAAAGTGTSHEVSDAVGELWNACEAAMPGSDFSEIWRHVTGH